MSNYRDDTQETIVLSSEAISMVKSGDVENFLFSEQIFSKLKHIVSDELKLSDLDLSKQKIKLDSSVGFSEFIQHKVKKIQLIEDFLNFSDRSFVKHKDIIVDSLGLGESQSISYRVFHIEPFNLSDVPISYKVSKHIPTSILKLKDSVIGVRQSIDLIEDHINMSDSTKDKLKMLVVDIISLGHSINQSNTTRETTLDSFNLNDSAILMQRDLITDEISMSDGLLVISNTIDLVIEGISLSDTLTTKRHAQSNIEANIAFKSATSDKKKSKSSISELIFLDAEKIDEGGVIAAWTATAQGWYVSRYCDFDYEQLIVLGNSLYAVSKNGVEQIKQGAQVINAKIQTALLDVGAGALVHPDSVILEYSLNGKLSLDVGTTQSGHIQKYNYILKKEPSEYLTNGRVVLGRGLRGRHFDFSVNIEGSTAYINDMLLNVINTKRRV